MVLSSFKIKMKGGKMQRKGLSLVVTTVIMVALVLLAIGIVWVVVNNLLKGSAEDVSIQSKCLAVNLDITAASCKDSLGPDGYRNCTLTVERGVGGDAFEGLKLVFTDATGSGSVVDKGGNIVELGTKTYEEINSTLIGTISKVEATVYFKDDSGNEQLCSGTVSYNL